MDESKWLELMERLGFDSNIETYLNCSLIMMKSIAIIIIPVT